MNDPEVEALAREMRLEEARALAVSRGDLVRAIELAIESRDLAAIETTARAIAEVADDTTRLQLGNRARAAAVRRKDDGAEGIIAEALGEVGDAVALFERAQRWDRAAALHRANGDIAHAGRALEHHLAQHPTDLDARLSLASLLLEAGRADAALRTIGNSFDPRAEELRVRAHERLGFSHTTSSTPTAKVDEKLLFGRYEVVREVASTPSSRVLEARDRLDRARVALKIFTGVGHVGAGRDALVRFRREMEILASIDAPTVVRPRALLDEGPTIVLPWLGGGNLDDMMARGRPTPRRAVEIVSRVLDALDRAHRRGVIHRDIKPANVLLDEAGGSFLADFGVAHLGDASSTATAGILGTLRYMAPEQRRGEPATARSDLFAVGIMLCELLGLPTDPNKIGSPIAPEVCSLFADLLADDPARRPEGAAELRIRIQSIAWPEHPIDAPPRSVPPSDRPAELIGDDRYVDDVAREGIARRDRLLERRELLILGDDARIALARTLALVARPCLPIVIGLDTVRGALRLESIEGAAANALNDHERAMIKAALQALHAAGATHGEVTSSLRRSARGVALAFPERAAKSGGAEADLRALASIPRF